MDQPEYKKYPDLLTSSLDLFLLPVDTFIKQFEKLKIKLGSDYVEKLASNEGLIEIMYEDEYADMLQHAKLISKRLTSGFYTKQAIEKAMK